MISVVIPTYKKTDILLKNLEINLPYLKGCEIIIVNDDPSESIQSSIKNLRGIILIENKKNEGFAGAVNAGIEKAKHPYVFLLNSDVVLQNDSFKTALEHFKNHPELFAVAFAQKDSKGAISGKNSLSFRKGMFIHNKAKEMTTGVTAWAEGGSSLFDRAKILKLGMLDKEYKPFYWEDIDLSYRAWKAGYEVIFDRSIVVHHEHETTIGSLFNHQYIKTVSHRNMFLFTWKNLTSTKLVLTHLLLLKVNLFWYGIVKKDVAMILGYLQALTHLPSILTHRNKIVKISDQMILKKLT